MSEHGIKASGRFNLVESFEAAQEDDQKREYRADCNLRDETRSNRAFSVIKFHTRYRDATTVRNATRVQGVKKCFVVASISELYNSRINEDTSRKVSTKMFSTNFSKFFLIISRSTRYKYSTYYYYKKRAIPPSCENTVKSAYYDRYGELNIIFIMQ